MSDIRVVIKSQVEVGSRYRGWILSGIRFGVVFDSWVRIGVGC